MKIISIALCLALSVTVFSGCFNMSLGEQAAAEIKRVQGATLGQYNTTIYSVDVLSVSEKGESGEVSATVCYKNDNLGAGRGPCETQDFKFKKTDKGWKMQGF